MILDNKGQSAKTQTRSKPNKTKPDSYTKLIKTRSTDTLNLKLDKSEKVLRFRKKTNSMLSYFLSEKNSTKTCKTKNNKKQLKAQKATLNLSKPLNSTKSIEKINDPRPISSLFSNSRPLFVEPSPVIIAQSSSITVSPGTPGNEGYKFPLLRNKQSQSFSLSLCPDSSKFLKNFQKISPISGNFSSSLNNLQAYPTYCSGNLNSSELYSFFNSGQQGQQASPKDHRHNSLPFINSR